MTLVSNIAAIFVINSNSNTTMSTVAGTRQY